MRIMSIVALIILCAMGAYGEPPSWVYSRDQPFLDDTAGLTTLKLSFYTVEVGSGVERKMLIVDKTFTLDGAGNVLLLELYDYAQKRLVKTQYLYDAQKRLIRRKTTGREGVFTDVAEYEYNGKVRTEKDYGDNGLSAEIRESFDDQNRLVESAIFDGRGNPQGRTKYEYEVNRTVAADYNSSGLPTGGTVTYLADGKAQRRDDSSDAGVYEVLYYAYDPEGNLASETCINKTGKQTFAVYYEYSNKKLLRETLARPDGSQYLTEYAHDEKGRLLQIQHTVKVIKSGVASVRMDYIISRTGMK